MISYGGVSLIDVTDDLAAWARECIDPANIWADFLHRTWPGQQASHLPFWPWVQRPVELGTLRWPSGASRFAVGYFLADDVALDAIRSLVFSGGWNPLALVLDDGAFSVTTSLYLMPSSALETGPRATHLLTLVDARYLWWAKAASLSITGGTTTWGQLYTNIGTALGVTITPDAVAAAYLKPPAQLALKYGPLPLLLDAVAASVGQRVVRKLDGTVLARNAVNALADGQTNLAAGWPQLAGNALAGADSVSLQPSSVTVVFPRQDTTAAPYTHVTAGNGSAGARVIRSTAQYDGTNAAELNALAARVAADWQAFFGVAWDIVYGAAAPWVPTALDDFAEWTQREDAVSTRIRCLPFDGWPDVLLHRSSVSEGNATLAAYSGSSLVPVGGYYGATGSSGDGTIGTMGDSSAGGPWVVKDGQVLKLGGLTVNAPAGGPAHGVSTTTFTVTGNATASMTKDGVGNASVNINVGTVSTSDTFTTLYLNSCTITTLGVTRWKRGAPGDYVIIEIPWEQCDYWYWCKGSETFTTDLTDWTPAEEKPALRLTADSPGLTIRSIDPGGLPGPDGLMLLIENVGSETYSISNNDTLGTDTMRVYTPTGATLNVPPRFVTWAQYDAATGRVRVLETFNLEVQQGSSTVFMGTNRLRAGTGLTINQPSAGVVELAASGGSGSFSGARVSGSCTVASGGSAPVSFDGSEYDTDSYITVTDDHFTIPSDGFYHVGAYGIWELNLPGEKGLTIYNVTAPRTVAQTDLTFAESSQSQTFCVSGDDSFAAGDEVQLLASQSDSGAQTRLVVATFWIHRLGPLP